jgi:hypothetical protein
MKIKGDIGEDAGNVPYPILVSRFLRCGFGSWLGSVRQDSKFTW